MNPSEGRHIYIVVVVDNDDDGVGVVVVIIVDDEDNIYIYIYTYIRMLSIHDVNTETGFIIFSLIEPIYTSERRKNATKTAFIDDTMSRPMAARTELTFMYTVRIR